MICDRDEGGKGREGGNEIGRLSTTAAPRGERRSLCVALQLACAYLDRQ